MADTVFALFVDIMGVQQSLTRTDIPTDAAVRHCRDTFEQFHRDLADTISMTFAVPAERGGMVAPTFVAAFSDAAYVVGATFETVAAAGVMLMRRALRHSYPLRGGIGMGTFSHETSGVTTREGQVWSTSSFFGSAVVTAYRAERSDALGLRVFVHEVAADAATSSIVAMPLRDAEPAPATHELRLWRVIETEPAVERVTALRDGQQLGERARAHYETTIAAYRRYALVPDDIPFATPALWLF